MFPGQIGCVIPPACSSPAMGAGYGDGIGVKLGIDIHSSQTVYAKEFGYSQNVSLVPAAGCIFCV